MKILQVTNFFKPSWEAGGVARVAYEISKNLVKEGHEVTVFTTDGFKSRLNVDKNKPLYIDGVRTYYFRNLSSYLSKYFVLPIPYYLPLIASKQLREFDIIHIHEYRTVSAIIIHYFSKKYNVPYVLQAHGTFPKTLKRKNLKTIFDVLFGKRILKGASKLFALNETEFEQYVNLGADSDKVKIVPNGIDETKYKELPLKGVFREEFGLEDSKIILYVGRLHKSKGVDLLIESFGELCNEIDDAKLVLIGPDDGFRNYLEQLVNKLVINDKVLFTGFVSISEKISAFVDSDIFVTPCFSGFPVTFLESCICGTPIVTTTKGDNLGWIEDNVGFVVPYDKDSLKCAMHAILTDNELSSIFRQNCVELIKKHYTLNRVVDLIEDSYREVLDER